jgi:phage-related protein
MSEPGSYKPILSVVFYVTAAGNEPVRDWLLGMPLIRKLEPGLREIRSHIGDGIARMLFTVTGDTMVLLHGFVKKSEKTPVTDLKTARQRMADLQER